MIIKRTNSHIALSFSYPIRVLSSAFYNGGMRRTNHIINLKTTAEETHQNTPETIVMSFLKSQGYPDSSVCLLTSAQFKFSQILTIQEQSIHLLAVITAGTSNALNITDRTPTPFNGEPIFGGGTINIIIVSNRYCTSDCMVSAVISATEAKTAALIDLGVNSTQSSRQATGTGTDSIAIVSGNGSVIQYSGGHTLFGQLIGQAVYTCITRALTKRITSYIDLDDIKRNFPF